MQVNFRQLPAETAGNRYLRRLLPASAGTFTCGTVYLRPLQVILPAPILHVVSQESRIKKRDEIEIAPNVSNFTLAKLVKYSERTYMTINANCRAHCKWIRWQQRCKMSCLAHTKSSQTVIGQSETRFPRNEADNKLSKTLKKTLVNHPMRQEPEQHGTANERQPR